MIEAVFVMTLANLVLQLDRKDVRRHADRCLPLIKDEVRKDIERLVQRGRPRGGGG